MKRLILFCIILSAGIMTLPGNVRAYDAVGFFLNFPQGDLDGVTRINVHISPFPFGVDQVDDYPPAYNTDLNYFSSIFGSDYTYVPYQGALGSDWLRLAYSSGVQSYEGTEPLLSEDESQPGKQVVVDGYVYENFPTISGVELDGYTGSVQTSLVFVDTITIDVPAGFFTIPVDVKLWQLTAEPDDTPPVVYLYGIDEDDAVAWTKDVAYQDLGVIAQDNVDGSIDYTELIITVNGMAGDPAALVDSSVVVGTLYTLTYSTTDEAGNVSDLRTRTVEIVPDQPPVIYLNGDMTDDDVDVRKGRIYEDQGVTAIDDVMGDISDNIVVWIDGVVGDPDSIDTSVSGVDYHLTYEVADNIGQSAVPRQRIVHVVNPPADSGGGGGGCFITVLLP